MNSIPTPSIKSSVTNADLIHHSALHAYLGYTDSFKAGDVVTQGYIDRLHDHYLPNLMKALEYVKPSIKSDNTETLANALARVKEVEGELSMSNDALITARITLEELGFPDLPFLDDGIANAINTLKARVAELEAKPTEEPWGDKRDQWSIEIDAAHPMKTGDHKTRQIANEMVGNRHSKGALVDLVNWLLAIYPQNPIEAKPTVTLSEDETVELMMRGAWIVAGKGSHDQAYGFWKAMNAPDYYAAYGALLASGVIAKVGG